MRVNVNLIPVGTELELLSGPYGGLVATVVRHVQLDVVVLLVDEDDADRSVEGPLSAILGIGNLEAEAFKIHRR